MPRRHTPRRAPETAPAERPFREPAGHFPVFVARCCAFLPICVSCSFRGGSGKSSPRGQIASGGEHERESDHCPFSQRRHFDSGRQRVVVAAGRAGRAGARGCGDRDIDDASAACRRNRCNSGCVDHGEAGCRLGAEGHRGRAGEADAGDRDGRTSSYWAGCGTEIRNGRSIGVSKLAGSSGRAGSAGSRDRDIDRARRYLPEKPL